MQRLASGLSLDVKIPGVDHPITIEAAPHRVTVRAGGRVIAETSSALVLREASLRPVYYIPIADVDASAIKPSDAHTYCPYKGDASYYSLSGGDQVAENAVWTYLAPYDAVSEIAGRVAFYPQHVDISVG